MIVKHLFYLLVAVVIGVFLLMPRVSNNKDSSLSSTTTTSNRIRLRSKNAMPLIGLGTAGIHGDAICDVLLKASQIGYRLVDSAAQVAVWYQNEKQIGDCVAANEHALSRKSLFLTTKLHPQDHGPTTSVAALKQSLANFRTDYIDLFIFHYSHCWGVVCAHASEGTFLDSLTALVPFIRNQTIRDFGVSNFNLQELEQVERFCASNNLQSISVVQDWFDPFHQAVELRRFCKQKGIVFQAYSPLGGQYWAEPRNPLLTNDVINRIARQRNATAAQIVLKWIVQQDVAVVPKSKQFQHLQENFDALSISALSEVEFESISRLARH